MSTSWSPPVVVDLTPVVEVVNKDGQHVYKVTSGPYLVGKGYFVTTDEVGAAVKAIGYSLANIKIKAKERVA